VLKVLIAEDDLMIADMIEGALVAHGYAVCGIAPTVAEATELAFREKPDLAIIDLRLADGGLGTEIAHRLRDQHTANVHLTAVNGHASLSKPYSEAALLRALELVSEIVATGKATPPFPRGFQILKSAVAQERV
jgi:DNA-binding response OmpR family regulator